MTILAKEEEITRYLFKGHFSRPDSKNLDYVKIKKNGFSPMENEQGIPETSIMKTTTKTLEEVEQIGIEHVAPIRNQALKGLVRFSVEVVISKEMKVKHDMQGHPDHGVILGWPASKEDWLEKADALVEEINKHPSKIFHEVKDTPTE